jgi:TolB protein
MSKTERFILLVTIAGVIVAILAWLLPFSPIGSSPFSLEKATPTNAKSPNELLPTFTEPPPRTEVSQSWWITLESDCTGNSEIYIVRADGTGFQRLTDNSAADGDSVVSPDGKRIAFFSERDGDREIYTMNIDGTNVRRLTNILEWDGLPAWSPSGQEIAFTSWRAGTTAIYVMNDDGSNVRQLTSISFDWMPTWSPDGKQIAFASYVKEEISEIFVIDVDGSNRRQLTHLNLGSFYPEWTPDGNRIIFASRDNQGVDQIFIMNQNGDDIEMLTSGSGGTGFVRSPWSPDGQQIAIVQGGNVYIMNADGSNVRLIKEMPAC